MDSATLYYRSLAEQVLRCPSAASHGLITLPSAEQLIAVRTAVSPIASVITPYYNASHTIGETALSVLSQTVMNLEWILVDDGSTEPCTQEVLARIAARDPRLRIIRQDNRGPASARNRGARHAETSHLLFLDADDLIEPTYVEKMLLALASFPRASWAYSGVVIFGADNRLWSEDFEPGRMFETNLCPMVSVVRKEAHEKAGGFDEHYEGHEDWDYWLRHIAVGQHGVLVRECLEHHRYRVDSRRVHNDALDPENTATREKMAAQYRHGAEAHEHWHGGFRLLYPIQYHCIIGKPLLDPARVVVAACPEREQVLILTNHFISGGADRFTLRMMEYLRAAGAGVTVALSQAAENEWLDRAYELTRDIFLLPHTVASALWLDAACWLIESRRITRIMVTQSVWAYHAAPLLATRYPHLPFFDYTHVEEPHWLNGGYPRLSGIMQPLWTRSFCNTNHLRTSMAQHYGHEDSTIEVFRTGIDTRVEFDPERYDREAIRREMGYERDVPIILHVSRLTEQKRPEVLPQILEALLLRRPGVILLVVGGDPAACERLSQEMEKRGLQHHYRWLPSTRDIASVLRAADCLLLPSRYEGLAMIAVEAMAMGLAVIASDVGGQREVFQDDIGWLIPLADSPQGKMTADELSAYVRALDEALALGTRHPRAGTAARERATSMYALEQTLRPFVQRLLAPQWRADEALQVRNAHLAPLMPQIENAYLNILSASEHDMQTFSLSYLCDQQKIVERYAQECESKLSNLWEDYRRLGEEWKKKDDQLSNLWEDHTNLIQMLDKKNIKMSFLAALTANIVGKSIRFFIKLKNSQKMEFPRKLKGKVINSQKQSKDT